jgi:hypothetical protein
MKHNKYFKIVVMLLILSLFVFGFTDTVLATPKKKIGIISLYLAAAVPPRIVNEAEKLFEKEDWKAVVVDTKSDKQKLISTCLI